MNSETKICFFHLLDEGNIEQRETAMYGDEHGNRQPAYTAGTRQEEGKRDKTLFQKFIDASYTGVPVIGKSLQI